MGVYYSIEIQRKVSEINNERIFHFKKSTDCKQKIAHYKIDSTIKEHHNSD